MAEASAGPSRARMHVEPARGRHHVLPGFGLALGIALAYLTAIVLIPLGRSRPENVVGELGRTCGRRLPRRARLRRTS